MLAKAECMACVVSDKVDNLSSDTEGIINDDTLPRRPTPKKTSPKKTTPKETTTKETHQEKPPCPNLHK